MDATLEGRGGWALLPDCDSFGSPCDPRDGFIDAWNAIENPLRSLPTPEVAMPLVEQWELLCSRWSGSYDGPFRRLVTLCYWYARLLDNDGRFFLSCRTAGVLLECSQTQAASHLRRAELEDLLEILS